MKEDIKKSLGKAGRSLVNFLYDKNTLILAGVVVVTILLIAVLIIIDPNRSLDGIIGKISNTLQISGVLIALLTWAVAWRFRHPGKDSDIIINNPSGHVALIISSGEKQHPDAAINYISKESGAPENSEKRKEVYKSILADGLDKDDNENWEVVDPKTVLSVAGYIVRKYKGQDNPEGMTINHIIPEDNKKSSIINIDTNNMPVTTEDDCHGFLLNLNEALEKVKALIGDMNNVHVFIAGPLVIAALIQSSFNNIKSTHIYHYQGDYIYVGTFDKKSFGTFSAFKSITDKDKEQAKA